MLAFFYSHRVSHTFKVSHYYDDDDESLGELRFWTHHLLTTRPTLKTNMYEWTFFWKRNQPSKAACTHTTCSFKAYLVLLVLLITFSLFCCDHNTTTATAIMILFGRFLFAFSLSDCTTNSNIFYAFFSCLYIDVILSYFPCLLMLVCFSYFLC